MNPTTRKAICQLHTHPDTASHFWQERLTHLGRSSQEIVEHPERIPPMTAEEMRPYGIEAFLPKPLRTRRPYLITSETSGFSGKPVLTCFTEAEFVAGFVDPFIRQAQNVNFPIKGNWLWAGPSGPHIVGKALREILRKVGGTDAFAIDFDPRWYKAQAKGALSARRYFQHIIQQIDDIMSRQAIDILYATPPIIEALCDRLDAARRADIRGVHYAGMAIGSQQYEKFHRQFPNAVHMSGYGNSLFGMFPETNRSGQGIAYATASDRLDISVVKQETDGSYSRCEVGDSGQLMVSRYDQSCLLLNMLLEDVAIRTEDGICNPHRPHHHLAGKLLY